MSVVLGFLQARMDSYRLPGKALLRIDGKTILHRAVERLRASRILNQVVVLTTTLDEDDAIAREARMLCTWIYRGPELDVLKRFCQAAEEFRPDIVVRATGDNPLIDIGSVRRIVRALRARNLDYCMERDLPLGAATEAMTREALERMDRLQLEPSHREHVTTYIKEHLEQFRVEFLNPPGILCRSELRITVDTPEDFTFVERLIERVPDSPHPLPLEEYLNLASTLSRERV